MDVGRYPTASYGERVTLRLLERSDRASEELGVAPQILEKLSS